MRIQMHKKIYKYKMLDKNKKMKKKRGFFTEASYALSDKRVGFLIFIILSLSFVLAGNMVFDGGNLEVDTNVLFVNSTSDRIGIGTTNPSTKLDVNGTITASGTDNIQLNVATTGLNSNAVLTLQNDVQIWQFFVKGDTATEDFRFYDATNNVFPFIIEKNTATNTLYLDNGGKVGIGTSSPSTILTIDNPNNTIDGILLEAAGNSQNSVRLFFDSDGITAGTNGIFRTAGNLVFTTGAVIGSSSGTQRLVINDSGKVGIGTTTPNQNLHVVGNTNVTGTIYYGSLQANSPHMFEADETGFTNFCVYDKLGYWNMIYWEEGIQKIDKNNVECNNKKTHLEEVETARENCESQRLLLNENDLSCINTDSD